MAFDWRDYLQLAHDLKNDPSECAQRTALGRSYYFVYHLGLETAKSLLFTGTLPGLHGKLWTWCEKQQDRNIKKLGTLGKKLYSHRLDADYVTASIPDLTNEVQIQLERAHKFEVAVAQITQRSPPQQLF